jgi:hypothetical protein
VPSKWRLRRLTRSQEVISGGGDADAQANDLVRVIDESGEDYLYPASLFQKLELPAEVERVLRRAS